MDRITGLFPLWAVLISAVAVVYPAPLIPLKWAIVPLLGVVMFGMGVTLTASDFTTIMKRPVVIALGVVLQFLLMPLIGWLLTRILSPGASGGGRRAGGRSAWRDRIQRDHLSG